MAKKTNSNKQQTTGNINPTRRAFFATMHIGSMKKTGLTEEQYMDPPTIAQFIKDTWEKSKEGREAGVVICMSADKVYHAHMGLYDENPTTLQQASKTLFNCHIELQKATKKELTAYLLKQPPYDEKGETVLYELNIGCIKDAQGKRSDLDRIEELLRQGLTPNEIMDTHFSYRRYENMIVSAYLFKRKKETPRLKENMFVEYHYGEPGSGKSHIQIQLAEEHSDESVYVMVDHENGGFDNYIKEGAAPIIVIDEMKGCGLKFGELLTILDKYSKNQTHCRYQNTYNLWEQVYMISVYPIEQLYNLMVNYKVRNTDSLAQLLRRINNIVYHYKEDGEYKTFSMPASEYTDHNDMMARLCSATDGFQKVTHCEQLQLPFEV